MLEYETNVCCGEWCNLPEEELRGIIYAIWCGLQNKINVVNSRIANLPDFNSCNVILECPCNKPLNEWRKWLLSKDYVRKYRIEFEDDLLIIRDMKYVDLKNLLYDVDDLVVAVINNKEYEI